MESLTTLLQREKKEGRVEGNGLQRCLDLWQRVC